MTGNKATGGRIAKGATTTLPVDFGILTESEATTFFAAHPRPSAATIEALEGKRRDLLKAILQTPKCGIQDPADAV
jgi:hypothetical protein